MLPNYGSWARGKDPYDIVTGFREIMKACGYELSQESSAPEIQHVLELYGSQTVFEQNSPAVANALKLNGRHVPSADILDLLDATGTIDKIDMRTVHGRRTIPAGNTAVVLLCGATIPWMERRVRQVVNMDRHSKFVIGAVYTALGIRQCNSSTEVHHEVTREAGGSITEAEAMFALMKRYGIHALGGITGTGGLSQNVKDLFDSPTILAHAKLVVPTNANATYVPLAVRRAIRSRWPDFDAREDQFSFCQDSFPLARTSEQAGDPANYQRPLTMIPALIRLVKELYLLNGGEPLRVGDKIPA